MKRKSPFSSPIQNKCKSNSTSSMEENSSDDLPLKEALTMCPNNQLNENAAGKGTTVRKFTQEQFLSAINDLGLNKKELDKETWRLNSFTRNKESVWSRLISKLELHETEPIRQSLYYFWRRNRQKLEKELSGYEIHSIVEGNESEKVNEHDTPSLNSEIKPLTTSASIPYPGTRAAVQNQLIQSGIIETSFILPYKEWKELYDKSIRDVKSGWTDVFYNKVRSCNFRCILVFKNHHITLENSRKINSSFFRCIATCKSLSCERTFEIFIKDEPIGRDSIVVRVQANGDENHSADENPVARHLTGKNRLAVGKAANAVGALKVFQDKVENADEEMLSASNFTGCETSDVIKHAAADYRKHYQLDEDIFRECRVRQQIFEDIDVTSTEIKGFVHVMGEKPFRLHLTSEGQILRYVKYCVSNTYSHVYIDATGSIVRNLPHQKTVLLYAAIFKDGNDPTNVIPLGHAILADHTATSISFFLGNLRQNIVTLKDKVIRPSFFVTDFSPAIFNAILQAFNHEDIRSHLKRCWNVLLRKYDAKELRSKSFLRFCCSHMMHAFARSLTAANVVKDIRKKVLHVFALFINCGELELSFKFLKRVLHMFGNPQAADTESILDAFLEAPYDNDDVPVKIGPCDFEMQEDSTDPLDQVDENMHSSKAIIHESPFNVEAIRRFPQLSELLDAKKKYENVANPLFSRRIIYVFYKWFAYLPLWTSLLTEFEDRYSNDKPIYNIEKYELGRLSNAQIESYFDILKNSILEKRTNMRPEEVIVSLYRTIQVQLKADKFGVCQKVKNRKGKPKDMNIEEPWKRKAKQKERSVHFSRIDKYNKKYLESKTIDLPSKKINSTSLAACPQSPPFIYSPKILSPTTVTTNFQSTTISPESKAVEPGSQPGVFDTLQLLTDQIGNKTNTNFLSLTNNLPNTGLSDNSSSSLSSKSAESFCGTTVFNENNSFDNFPTMSASFRPISPMDIFSALELENSNNIKPSLENELKRNENLKNQKKQYNYEDENTTTQCTHQQKPPSCEVIETLNLSRVRQHDKSVVIQQQSLVWPSFGITKTSFKGQAYSVTNTCNIDSPLFALYAIFRTEPNINNIVSNSSKEPFLSLRRTFELVDSEGWDMARLFWLTVNGLLCSERYNHYNAYGSIDGNTLRFIKNNLQIYQNNNICSRHDCTTRERKLINTEITLEHWETCVFQFSCTTTSRCGNFIKTVNEVSLEEANRLGYKRHTRNVMNIETDTTEEEDGWLCNGEVLAEPSYFIHGFPPFLFVDVVHPTINDPNSEGIIQKILNFHDIQRTIMIGSSTYRLRATINHHADHFTATIIDSTNRLFLYNDLHGVNEIDQSPLHVETAVYVLQNQ